jgi:hypothetical protein
MAARDDAGASTHGLDATGLGSGSLTAPGSEERWWALQQGHSTPSIWLACAVRGWAQQGSERTSCIASQKKYVEPARAFPEMTAMARNAAMATRMRATSCQEIQLLGRAIALSG